MKRRHSGRKVSPAPGKLSVAFETGFAQKLTARKAAIK